jgi:hypothetical protein
MSRFVELAMQITAAAAGRAAAGCSKSAPWTRHSARHRMPRI